MSVQLSFDDVDSPRGLTRAELMTAREVADLIAVPISTVREWGRNGTLPRVKLGRHVRYIRSHVEAAILHAEERQPPVTPAVSQLASVDVRGERPARTSRP